MKFKVKKRFIKLFICFVLLFLGIFICIKLFSKGYTNKYTLEKGRYKISEIYTEEQKNEKENYYIEIETRDLVYNFQLFNKKSSSSKLVKEVLFYDGDYKCLLPVLKDTKVDFSCYKDGYYYDYGSIKGIDKDLDSYIEKVDKEKYNINDFEDSLSDKKVVNKIKYYNNNLINKYIISMTDLSGIVTMDKSINFIEIFSNETYSRNISIYIDNYYVTANYSKKQQFTEFYIVDLLKEKVKILKTPNYISFDSYIQGVVNNEIYLYDIDNEKQYKISLEDNRIVEVGNKNNEILYYNINKWDKISTIKAKKIEYFKYIDDSKFEEYDYVYKNGNKLSGYYYLLKENNDKYDVYRVNVQNINIKKYVFTISNYQDIQFIDDIVLYKDNDNIKLYSDKYGIKTILNYSELKYNENIKFYILKK